MGYTWTIVVLVVLLGITWRYLGSYMASVFDGRVHYMAWAERPVYRVLHTGTESQHGRLIPYQHQLAELRGGDDHVVLLPDRRADVPAVREPRYRDRRRHCHGAGLLSP